MDIQTTHVNTLQNNLIVNVSGNNDANSQASKIMYGQTMNQPILSQQIQEQPPTSLSNQQMTRDPNEAPSHSTNSIPQDTIPIRNIKAVPQYRHTNYLEKIKMYYYQGYSDYIFI